MKKFLNLSKIAIAVFLVAIVLKGDNHCPAVDPLDHTVLLPDPSDCASFFLCSNGVPILQRCPEGLHFNAHLNVCDWPQNAGRDDCINLDNDETGKPGGDRHVEKSECRVMIDGDYTREYKTVECPTGGVFYCTPSFQARTLDPYGVPTSDWETL